MSLEGSWVTRPAVTYDTATSYWDFKFVRTFYY
jgi:hypothetical protein